MARAIEQGMTNTDLTLDQLTLDQLDALVAELATRGAEYGIRIDQTPLSIVLIGALGEAPMELSVTTERRLRSWFAGFLRNQPAYKQSAPLRVTGLTGNQLMRIAEEVECLRSCELGLRGTEPTFGRTFIEAHPLVLADVADRLTLAVESVEDDPASYVDGYCATDAQFEFATKQVIKTYTTARAKIAKALRTRGIQ
jgi:hypothetical protein